MVEGGSGRRFRYARLPFGWSYSPTICQHLVLAMVRWVLVQRGIRGWDYLDDILLSARRKSWLRRAVQECVAPEGRVIVQGCVFAKTLVSLASGLSLALASKFPIIPKGVLWEWLSANGT